MDAWLRSARDAIAAESGISAKDLELTPAEIRTLLDLARVAAHDSGERTNAPLLCYLLGVAAARGGVELGPLAEAVTRD